MAFLTDMFASSCGGPNIRAVISHGSWDTILNQELAWFAKKEGRGPSPSSSCDALWDMVQLVLVAMEVVATRGQSTKGLEAFTYRPIFSYTATTLRNIKQAWEALIQMFNMQQSAQYQSLLKTARANEFGGESNELSSLSVPFTRMQELFDEILPLLNDQDNWTVDMVFAEFQTNQQLASCGASRMLLKDVAEAVLAHATVLSTNLSSVEDFLNSDETLGEGRGQGGRQQRRLLRIVFSTEMACRVYGFSFAVAIESVKHELMKEGEQEIPSATLRKAVERSRMVVSTVSTFIITNADRAVKAACDYARGKAIRELSNKFAETSKP